MLKSLDAIQERYPQYAIPEAHLQAIAATADTEQVVIGLRPVSSLAKPWIEKGYPTKSFAIKNKSTRMGPCQGLIAMDPDMGLMGRRSQPKDQAISKKENTKYLEQLQEALKKDTQLTATPLYLSNTEFERLNNQGVNIERGKNPVQLTWSDETGQTLSARAIYDTKTQHYALQYDDGRPIQVLGKRVRQQKSEVTLPITADYDLLVVCPQFSQLSPGSRSAPGIDRSPLRTQSSNSDQFRRVRAKEMTYTQEDPKGGNWLGRIQHVVDSINKSIANLDCNRTDEELQMVHHNAEFSNPFAGDLSDSLPATFIVPKTLNHSNDAGIRQQIWMAETVADLNELRESFQHDNGYYWPSNAQFNAQIPVFQPKIIETIRRNIQMKAEHSAIINQQPKKIEEENNNENKPPPCHPSN